MKKWGLFLLFTILCVITFAQSHTYNACCRYGKGNVMGDCICPACKKDKEAENKALQEEAKQQQAKAAAETVQKEMAIKEQREQMLKKKEAQEKANNQPSIESPSKNEVEKNIPFQPLIPSGYNSFRDKEYVGIKKGEKVIFKSSAYKSVNEINTENKYFNFSNPSKNPESGTRNNNAHIYNTNGKRITIDGTNAFNGIKYNEKENCIYITILTGKTTKCLKPFGLLFTEEEAGKRVEYYSGYFTEEYINKLIKLDSENAESWVGRCQDSFDEVIVLKVDNDMKLLKKFAGYCRAY